MSEMEEEAVAGMHASIIEEDANSLLDSTANDSLTNDENDEVHENGQECCDETDGSDAKSTNSLGLNELSREMMEDIIGVIGGNKKSHPKVTSATNDHEYSTSQSDVNLTPVTANNADVLTTEASSTVNDDVATTTMAATDPVAMETTRSNSDDNVKSEAKKRKNRELNSILALSKEARLDTNIAHKRNNTRNSTSSPSLRVNSPTVAQNSESGAAPPSAAATTPVAAVKYPVTAEAELDTSPTFNNNVDGHDIDSNDVDGASTASSAATATTTSSEKKPKRSNLLEDVPMFKPGKDMFCWRCHREGVNIACETCPRSYHQKCLKQTAISDIDHWPCPECVEILKAESTETRSEAMKNMTLEHLCSLLKFACSRMVQCQGAEPFIHPVNERDLPDYKKYIVNAMNLTLMERNIKDNLYGSTQAFEADAKWILHNSIVYNSFHSKLTTAARGIVKICKQEMAEIENCPSCYLNANTKKNTWFVEVCPKPHLLVWAKLKGFPYWPAKAMSSNSQGMVDVRFFGAHDRAWVPVRECYIYSVKDPNSYKQKRYDIEKCIKELNVYVENLRKIYGEVKFAPYKTYYDPDNEEKQLQQMLPQYRSDQKMKLTKVDYNKSERKESSKKNPDDTMEGYGTDDDDEDNDSDLEINNLRRKLLMKKSGVKDDESENNVMESEADDEATNLNTFAGKLNLTPKSTGTSGKRRRGSDDDGLHSPPPTRKLRRNSDHSIKSDSSSRMSSVSSSKTEEGDGSPNSKMKITDKLMKRLSDGDKGDKEGDKEKKDEKSAESTENAAKANSDVPKKEPVEDKKKVNETKAVEDPPKSQIIDKKSESSAKLPEKSNLCSLAEKFNNSEITLEKIPKSSDANGSSSAKRRYVEQEPTKIIKLVKKRAPLPATTKEPPTEMICQPDIKIEPEDDEEDDVEYMEAKRQYLSALNISEKSKSGGMNNNGSGSDKVNEIRTRSKTEERKNDNKRRTVALSQTPPVQRPPSAKSDISVKQFAKIVSMSPAAANNNNSNSQNNQRARKSFPMPNYAINKSAASPGTTASSTVVMVTSKSATPVPPLTTISGLPSLEPIRPNSLVVLAPSQFLANSGATQSFILPPLVASSSSASNTSVTTAATSTSTITTPLNVRHSQNYIPQNELDAREDADAASAAPSSTSTANTSNNAFSLSNLRTMVFTANNNNSNSNNSGSNGANAASSTAELAVASTTAPAAATAQNDDLSVLHSLLPENLGRAVSDLLCRPMPKLHKRPPGALSALFDSGVPSSAGPVSSKINSMAHRLSDYFRGMLIETLEDMGKVDCPEATITSLQREIETLKHKHEMEIVEIRKNVCTVLRDIQKCILEEKEKIVDQTRAACEAEALKRIEEAKSKQWCANCSKEAQFYCCWNTSYCDYPCQQKHWPSHMNKCTQSQNASQSNTIRAAASGGQQIVLRPANPPPKGSNFPVNRIIAAKPAKIFRPNTATAPKTGFKVQAANAASHLTLVESTPGNYELVGNGALTGKILTTNTVMSKIKPTAVSAAASPSTAKTTTTINISDKPKDNVTLLDDSD